jgi:uncharacterized membrane protein YeaQ/YmgE (transglycosylase-associated protein family)
MGIILWVIFGAISGWIASVIMKIDSYQSAVTDIILGIVGAIFGGFLMSLFNQPGVTGFNLYSLIVSVIGAVVIICLGRLIQKR